MEKKAKKKIESKINFTQAIFRRGFRMEIRQVDIKRIKDVMSASNVKYDRTISIR